MSFPKLENLNKKYYLTGGDVGRVRGLTFGGACMCYQCGTTIQHRLTLYLKMSNSAVWKRHDLTYMSNNAPNPEDRNIGVAYDMCSVEPVAFAVDRPSLVTERSEWKGI